MTTIDLTLHGESASDLARYLRAVAERFEAEGEAALPTAGYERPVRVDDALVGAITAPGRRSFEDVANLAGAERVGNIRTLDQAHTALLALVDVLRDHDMPPARYHGLLTAVDLVGSTLGERAEFIREKRGGSHHDL